MSKNIKTIVSMIAGEDKLTLITIKGELIDIANGDIYDTEKMVDELTPKITGIHGIEVDLDAFLIIKEALFPQDYENKGDIIVRVVEGKEIKGIFFPLKMEVAVKVGDQEVVIPKAENLTKQMNRAIDQNSPAVANFMRRVGTVVAERKHSAEDLMEFIKHCDLPLTDAGDIIGYKKVKSHSKGGFVDSHSGSVHQNIGYRVYTDVEKVDPDRTKSCSNGLHVGSLNYMSSFHGNHILVCLVRPEDFIAVPEYDTTKCRVCSYDIIGVLTPEECNTINKGEHIEQSRFNIIISDAVAGKTVPITHTTYVKGIGHTEITELNPETKPTQVTTKSTSSGESLRTDTVTKKGTKVVEKAKAAKAKTISEQTQELYIKWNKTQSTKALDALLSLKKTKKKSWSALGLNEVAQKQIQKALDNQ